jgi:hypothetical protein
MASFKKENSKRKFMKRISAIFIFMLSAYFSFTQVNFSDFIEGNSVKGQVNTNGLFFNSPNNYSRGYEFPKGSGNQLMTFSNFWFGGVDSTDALFLAAYDILSGGDLFPGPYSSTNSYTSPDYGATYINSVWSISKEQIEYHLDNFEQNNYTPIPSILNWPGNGLTSVGVSEQLAPYVDADNDGIYNPLAGDYPCVRGDVATYVIMNDDALPHLTGGVKIGIEVHFMFYQFLANDFIDSTTFINVQVINKGQHELVDFKTTYNVDIDIGFPFDDYRGCDSMLNLSYGYNATSFDPNYNGASGYGANPPAVGVVSLNKKMASAGGYVSGGMPTCPTCDPIWPINYWNYMNSKWRDGTPWYYGGVGHHASNGVTTQPTNYQYSGNPYTGLGWSEMNTDGNGTTNPADEDKRFLMTMESQQLFPGDTAVYDLGIVAYMQGNHLENVQGLLGYAVQLQDYYDNIMDLGCTQTGTGIADTIVLVNNELPYDRLFEITRLDGEGNMSMPVMLHELSEAQILAENQVDSVRYRRGEGPIYVELYDTVNYAQGYYVLKVLDNEVDTSEWRLLRYDEQNGAILDSAESMTTLIQGDTVLFPQYGLKITVRQDKYICNDGSTGCPNNRLTSSPIKAELRYFDNGGNAWLTGVKHNYGFNPENWMTSGEFYVYAELNDPSLGDGNPDCYNALSLSDPQFLYDDLLGGIITNGQTVRFDRCPPYVLGVPLSFFSYTAFQSIAFSQLSSVYHPSIDIVFTSDQSKWTRCPVIELCDDVQNAIGGVEPGLLRGSPSVDKNGNPDGTGNGMSWFPGYAIDVETGRRLNLAFGENSSLVNENGSDMIWNPTSTMYDANGTAVFGGQHVIYAFGGQFDDMPNYDEGVFIQTKLNELTSLSYRAVYKNLSWVMQPILEDGATLLESDARLLVRINKEFKLNELSGLNQSRPMFAWTVGEYSSDILSIPEIAQEIKIKLYPNPATQEINLEWDAALNETIVIYSLDGRKLKEQVIHSNERKATLNISELTPGVYIAKIGNYSGKFIVR